MNLRFVCVVAVACSLLCSYGIASSNPKIIRNLFGNSSFSNTPVEFKEVTNSLDENLKNKIKTGLDDKASYNDLELLYKKIKKDTNDRLNCIEDDTKNTLNNFDKTINIL